VVKFLALARSIANQCWKENYKEKNNTIKQASSSMIIE